MRKLYIGNKNYSSWSMRPWVLLTEAGIEFEEIRVRFDSFDAGSAFKQTLSTVSPTGKVPLLVDDGLVVWDTLSIAEYLAEKFPQKMLWPQDPGQRAHARSICAEMHSGFAALRNHCPMNIEADLASTGALVWRDQSAVRSDVQRIGKMWETLLSAHGGPLLFGNFSISDAYFSPVVMRLRTYTLPVSSAVSAYIARVCELPSVRAWMEQARAEHDFRDFEEPYRLQGSM